MSKHNRWLIISIVGAIMIISLAAAAKAATLEVGPSGSGYTYISIQEAINDAVDGDQVLVQDGTYMEKIYFSQKTITVKSVNGEGSTIIDGNASGSVVRIGANSVLNGFTITNGLFSRIYNEKP
jgi:hypothetical protein